MSLTNPFYA